MITCWGSCTDGQAAPPLSRIGSPKSLSGAPRWAVLPSALIGDGGQHCRYSFCFSDGERAEVQQRMGRHIRLGVRDQYEALFLTFAVCNGQHSIGAQLDRVVAPSVFYAYLYRVINRQSPFVLSRGTKRLRCSAVSLNP